MELTLTHNADQHDTQISVTCDGQFSHTFDQLTLVQNSENHLPQPLDDPIAYGKAIYQALFPPGTPAQQTLSKRPERLLLVLTDEDLTAMYTVATIIYDSVNPFELGVATDVFAIAPGHDSWVIGEEPYVSLHFLGAEAYAS